VFSFLCFSTSIIVLVLKTSRIQSSVKPIKFFKISSVCGVFAIGGILALAIVEEHAIASLYIGVWLIVILCFLLNVPKFMHRVQFSQTMQVTLKITRLVSECSRRLTCAVVAFCVSAVLYAVAWYLGIGGSAFWRAKMGALFIATQWTALAGIVGALSSTLFQMHEFRGRYKRMSNASTGNAARALFGGTTIAEAPTLSNSQSFRVPIGRRGSEQSSAEFPPKDDDIDRTMIVI